MSSDFDNPAARPKTAAGLMHPDGTPGDIQSGNPSEPSARPIKGNVQTGIPSPRESPDDFSSTARRTLGEWLDDNVKKNITKISNADVSGPLISSIGADAFDNSNPVQTRYAQDPNAFDSESIPTARPELGPQGNANTMLRDVETTYTTTYGIPEPNDPAASTNDMQNFGQVMLQRNRFSPNTPLSTDATGFAESGLNELTWANSQKIRRPGKDSQAEGAGAYGKYINYTDTASDKVGHGLKMDMLQAVAEQLLLNAVGDTTTPLSKDGGNKGDAATDFGGGKLLSGFGQLGRNRGSTSGQFNADEDYRPAKALSHVLGNAGRSSRENLNETAGILSDAPVEDLKKNENYKRKSFGVLNNHLEMFASPLPTSMILLAAIAALSMIVAALVIALIIDVLGMAMILIDGEPSFKPTPSYQDSKIPHKMPLGQAFGYDDYGETGFFSALYRWLQLPPLEADYSEDFKYLFPFTAAASVGSIEFFIGNAFIKGYRVPQITTISAGFYVVVVRNALRDLDQVNEAAEDMGGGFVGAIEGFFALIEALTSSATFKFLRTILQIGDVCLKGGSLWFQESRDNSGINPDIDQLLIEHQSRAKYVSDLGRMVRMGPDTNRLAYSFSALPQVFLGPVGQAQRTAAHPGSYFELMSNYVGSLGSSGISIAQMAGDGVHQEAWHHNLTYNPQGRINTTFRESMEAELDSYYVPFYFHDMRTNEILPLPCFVENISDSFSPKYSQVQGFGRLDPVQIYQNTTRKIGMSFYMVATNPDDLEQLYIGINKLVSMVYPQWGGARRIVNGKLESFSAPYSQVMTASPLIRIRLGNLFHSNRTVENVRKLFGEDEDYFSVPPDPEIDDLEALKKDLVDLTDMMDDYHDRIETAKAQPAIAEGMFKKVLATNLLNPSGKIEPPLGMNLAAGLLRGEDPSENVDFDSFLLPHGSFVILPPGKYEGALWKAPNWRRKRGNKAKFDQPVLGKIVNYATIGGAKVDKKSDAGALKNQLYYVVDAAGIEPGPSDLCEAKLYPASFGPYFRDEKKSADFAGVMVPVQDIFPAFMNSATKKAARFALGLASAGTMHAAEISIGPLERATLDANKPPIPSFGLPGVPPTSQLPNKELFFEANPVTAAMRDSGGKGLAGFIQSLDFDWNQAPWSTDPGKQAPSYCKVTLSFAPVHDEPLGLNRDGSLRAAAYPVGSRLEKIVGSYGVTNIHRDALKTLAASIASAQSLMKSAASRDDGSDSILNPEDEV